MVCRRLFVALGSRRLFVAIDSYTWAASTRPIAGPLSTPRGGSDEQAGRPYRRARARRARIRGLRQQQPTSSSSSSTSSSTNADGERQPGDRGAGARRDQSERHAQRRQRSAVRAERVHRPRRPHGDRHGRRPDERARRGDGAEGRTSSTRTSKRSSPGSRPGRYDVGASSFTDTKEREKTVDFVTTSRPGISFYAKSSANPGVSKLADLCGKTVAVEKGTVEHEEATKQSKKCTKEGKKAVTVLSFPGQNPVNLAIASGRAELGMADSPVVAYQIKQSNGALQARRRNVQLAPYGIAIPKTSGMTAADPGGAEGADRRTATYTSDPDEVGHPVGRDQRPEDQRRDQLSERSRCPPREVTDPTGTARGHPGRPGAPARALDRGGDRRS